MEVVDEDVMDKQVVVQLTQQIATLEEENTSLKNELASLRAESVGNGSIDRGRRGEASGRRIRRGGVCKHSCAHHKELMDPAVWSDLPGDILQMVFARLPLTHIIRLQCLSREWRRIAKEPGFRQLCASAEPNSQMLAWVSEDLDVLSGDLGVFAIRLWDNTSRKWHAFEVATPHDHIYFDTMLACDGGLVCFVSRMKDKEVDPLIILVVNPLTREWRFLPTSAALQKVQPIMVQLVMDRGTMCYRVLVVAENRRGGLLGWVYTSATGLWSSSKSTPGLIFGNEFRWTVFAQLAEFLDRAFFEGTCLGPCVYDCSKGQLLELGEGILESCIDYALVNDRLFVLYEDETDLEQQYTRYVISEYQCPHMTEEMVITLSDGYHDEDGLEYVNLQACKGFLFVTAEVVKWDQTEVFTWLYELSTRKWHTIPILPEDPDTFESSTMCELRWDAVP